MTSGSFTSFPIGKIIVNRQTRQRKEVFDDAITSLAESIGRLGLIHPIVITRGGELVAGETRLLACQRLGWTSIPVQFTDELDESALKQIELEENVKRKDISWQDQCLALAELHDLYAEREGWTQDDTANAIGIPLSSAVKQLAVAKELRSGNKMVAEAPTFSTAKGIVIRKNERAKADELDVLTTTVKRTAPAGSAQTILDPIILNEDFREWARTYDGPLFNLIHCDFPYGIGADKFNQGAAKSFGGYTDTEEVYWELCETLIYYKEKLLGNSGHILFWFSMKHYAKTLMLLKQNFWVDEFPLIWNKISSGTLPNPEMGPRRCYETAFLCSHGDRKIIRAVSNVSTEPIARDGEHMSEKSQKMLEEFFRMLVDGNTRLLDPTCGSGSALRAADKLGAKSVLGLEINPEFAKLARLAWEKRK